MYFRCPPLQIRSTVLTAAKAHKCYNIFTPTSHCVWYIPSNIPVSSKKSSFIEGHSIFMVSYDEKFTIFTCMTLIIICPAVSLPLLTLDSGATAMVSCDRVQLVELLSTTLTTSLAYHII